jgi:hypothetical protein
MRLVSQSRSEVALISKIDAQLSYKQSRSGWIQDACRTKFGGSRTVADSSDSQLLAALFTRGVITKEQFDLLTSV